MPNVASISQVRDLISAMGATKPADLVMTVDGSDRPVGAITRGELASRQDIHYRTAHAFVFSGRALLLQELGADQDRNVRRLGSSVAAYVRPGESYRDALDRRAEEELGLRLELDLVGKTEMRDIGGTKHIALFAAVLPTRQLHILEPGHVAAVRWTATEAIAREITIRPEAFTETFVVLFESFYPHGRGRAAETA